MNIFKSRTVLLILLAQGTGASVPKPYQFAVLPRT